MSFQLSFSEGQAKNPDRKWKQCIDARACSPVWKGMILHPLLVWPLPTYLAHVCVPIPSDLRGNSPLQIFWPAQCLDSLTVHKVDRQCIFGLDKRPTKVWCKEARHVGCWDDVSQQLSNFHRTAYLDFCWCNECIFSRGKYMSEKSETVYLQIWVFWNCLSWSTRTSSKLFIKIFFKLSTKISET